MLPKIRILFILAVICNLLIPLPNNVYADELEINAVVPASPQDFDADIELTDPSGNTFPQETVLSYTLTYGSHLTTATTITVEAEWSLGTVNGSGNPSVSILDYVPGSASDGYNSTPPVVDPVNRKITWEIHSFPANTTGKTVTFQLKTNTSYKGDETVSFNVSGRVLGPGTQTPDSIVTKYYQYDPSLDPTPTPTATPTTIFPTSKPSSSTPTPTPIQESLPPISISNVVIREITESTALISATTNISSNITLSYGTSPFSLINTVSSKNTSHHTFQLTGLAPNTKYYFQLTTQNESQNFISELFTFTTASIPIKADYIIDPFVVISKNVFIYDSRLAAAGRIEPAVVIPTRFPYTFTFSINNYQDINSITAFTNKKSGLSIINNENALLFSSKPGEYTATLLAPDTPGKYTLSIKITDKFGNIIEKKVSDFKIIHPFTIFEERSNIPLESVKVLFYLYSSKERIYRLLDPSLLSVKNPALSNPDGTLSVILPQGKYKAEIESFQHKNKTIEFVIGGDDGEEFPIVYLEKKPFSFFTFLMYLFETLKNFYINTVVYLELLNQSYRTFELIAFASLFLLTLLGIQSFFSRTNNSPASLYFYFLHSSRFINKNRPAFTKGIIRDAKTERPIAKAIVTLFKNNTVLAQTMTNKYGIFFTKNKEIDQIEVEKIGYRQGIFPFNQQFGQKIPVFFLSNSNDHTRNPVRKVKDFLHAGFGMLFEFFVILLLLLELLFIPTVGLLKVLPFLLITISMIAIFLHQSIIEQR